MYLPPQIITFLVAMMPLSELRGAIPLALGVYGLSPFTAFIWAVSGNLVSVFFLLLLLQPVSNYLSHRFYFFNRFFVWLFERTRRKHNHSFEVWGSLVLVAFVAIPFPLTGAWTGAVVAFVFGIPPKKAFALISLGVFFAGLIVSLISLGVLSIS